METAIILFLSLFLGVFGLGKIVILVKEYFLIKKFTKNREITITNPSILSKLQGIESVLIDEDLVLSDPIVDLGKSNLENPEIHSIISEFQYKYDNKAPFSGKSSYIIDIFNRIFKKTYIPKDSIWGEEIRTISGETDNGGIFITKQYWFAFVDEIVKINETKSSYDVLKTSDEDAKRLKIMSEEPGGYIIFLLSQGRINIIVGYIKFYRTIRPEARKYISELSGYKIDILEGIPNSIVDKSIYKELSSDIVSGYRKSGEKMISMIADRNKLSDLLISGHLGILASGSSISREQEMKTNTVLAVVSKYYDPSSMNELSGFTDILKASRCIEQDKQNLDRYCFFSCLILYGTMILTYWFGLNIIQIFFAYLIELLQFILCSWVVFRKSSKIYIAKTWKYIVGVLAYFSIFIPVIIKMPKIYSYSWIYYAICSIGIGVLAYLSGKNNKIMLALNTTLSIGLAWLLFS